jgi:glycosyltransferase involved in cell wall biosynthesis
MDEETPKPAINPSDLGKVVVLCGSFPPMPCGVGDSAYELARELASMGVDIEAVCDVAADSDGPFPVHAEVEHWGFWRMKKLVRTIESLEPDILHIHYPSKAYGSGLGVPYLPMVLRSRRWKFKIVATLHEFRLSHRLRRLASFTLIDPCNAVVMPCPLELEALIQRHVSTEEKIHEAIPVGPVGPSPDDYTDEQKLSLRQKYRSDWGVTDDQPVLLHWGTPSKSKGIEVLFKALRLLKLEGETPLVVIAGDYNPGENDFHKILTGQPRGLGVFEQVKWLGRRSYDELAGIFLGADIGVFPFLDGFSFRRSSLVGVLRWGLPIITTKPNGIIDGLDMQDKVKFIARNDPKALATALINMMVNPRALQVARDAPNPMMAQFQWRSIAERWLDIYSRVLET